MKQRPIDEQKIEDYQSIRDSTFLSYLNQYESYDKIIKEDTLYGIIIVGGLKIDFQMKYYGEDIEINLQNELHIEEDIEEIKRSVIDDNLAFISNKLNCKNENISLVLGGQNKYYIRYRQLGNDDELIWSQGEKLLINTKKKIEEIVEHILTNGDSQIDHLIDQLSPIK